jgi:TRAP-type C4-dicarboxylate transport system permease small subunit
VPSLLPGGRELEAKTLHSGQLSPALQIPVGWVYLAVPVAGLLFLAFSLERIVELLAGKQGEA